jgi:hypothetical protein
MTPPLGLRTLPLVPTDPHIILSEATFQVIRGTPLKLEAGNPKIESLREGQAVGV